MGLRQREGGREGEKKGKRESKKKRDIGIDREKRDRGTEIDRKK